MSDQDRKKDKNHAHFWRATRFLATYKHLVIISICTAFFVGLAFVGGMGSILPIMQVLIEGETIRDWADRNIVERRLDIKIGSEDQQHLRVVSLKDGPAKTAGVKAYD